jgi:hypothetical protein
LASRLLKENSFLLNLVSNLLLPMRMILLLILEVFRICATIFLDGERIIICFPDDCQFYYT